MKKRIKPNENGILWELSYRLDKPRPGFVRDVFGYYKTEKRAEQIAKRENLLEMQIREVLA